MAEQPKGLYKRNANSRMRTISLDRYSDDLLSQMVSPGSVSNFIRALIAKEAGRREVLREMIRHDAANA